MKHSIKQLSVLIIFCSFSIPVFTQDFLPLFGEASKSWLEMKSYAPDPQAEAVVMRCMGEMRFTENVLNDFEAHFIKRIKIKIFNNKGYRFGEVEIPFYNSNTVKESVAITKASTFNLENGVIVKTDFDKKSVFIENINENWKRMKFALPNVKDGSVIEYEYEFVTDDLLTLPVWDFQMEIPVMNSEFTFNVVPYYEYAFLLQGANKFSSQKSAEGKDPFYFRRYTYHEMIYQFTMNNLPAFRDEAYITSMNDYQIKMEFQLSRISWPDGVIKTLISTWPELNDKLLKMTNFGKYLNSSGKFAEKLLNGVDFSGLNEQEKIEKISELVKMNFKWNGLERTLAVKSPKEFFEQKTGNSAEINLFLLACLNTQAIEAYPVVLSTRENGKIKADYPFLSFFDYTMAAAKTSDKYILLDATNIFLPYDKIPINCINESGLLVQKKSQAWINLSSRDQGSSIIEYITIAKNPDSDSLDCSFRITSNGYDAANMKERTGIKYEKIKEDLISRGLNPRDSIKIKNFVERKKDYILEFTSHQEFNRIENKIMISPFFREPEQENKLKSPDRKYPVDFIYRQNRQFVTTIMIPDGYKISYLPPDFSMNNDLVNISYSTKKENNILMISGKYEYKRSVYEPKDYMNLKVCISEIVKRFNDKILFEKI